MAQETERKFLVVGDSWRKGVVQSQTIKQAYLAQNGRITLRVRIVDGEKAVLTIKAANAGTSRDEFDYSIPLDDARALVELREGVLIEKTRHIVPAGRSRWEIDVFDGAHKGLVVAEIELPHPDATFARTDWLGDEVTDDPRYYNANLAAGGG